MQYYKNNTRETKSFKLLGNVYTMEPESVIAADSSGCPACLGKGEKHKARCFVDYFTQRTYGVWMSRATAEEFKAKPCAVQAIPPKSKLTPKPRPLGADTFGPVVTMEDPEDDEVSPAVVMAHAGIMSGKR